MHIFLDASFISTLQGLLEMNHLSPCCIHKPDLSSALLFLIRSAHEPNPKTHRVRNILPKKRAFHSHSIYSWFMWYEENCWLFCLVWKWVPHQAWKSPFLLPLSLCLMMYQDKKRWTAYKERGLPVFPCNKRSGEMFVLPAAHIYTRR